MNFSTPYKREKTPPENNSGEIKVERSGYVSAETRINNLMLAGQRLIQSRKESYDFPDGNINFNFNDPTRRKGYDLADAFQDNLEATQRLKSSQTAQKLPEQLSKGTTIISTPDTVKTE